jgi:hypothetical protein
MHDQEIFAEVLKRRCNPRSLLVLCGRSLAMTGESQYLLPLSCEGQQRDA